MHLANYIDLNLAVRIGSVRDISHFITWTAHVKTYVYYNSHKRLMNTHEHWLSIVLPLEEMC